MYKRLFMLLTACSVVMIILWGCGRVDAGSATTGNTVHMNDTNFTQSSITIQKGERLTLVADTFTPHIITNGTWESGNAHPGKEQGAPQVENVQVSGNSSETIGPFTTAGTFQLYCTVHANMNLTVIVH